MAGQHGGSGGDGHGLLYHANRPGGLGGGGYLGDPGQDGSSGPQAPLTPFNSTEGSGGGGGGAGGGAGGKGGKVIVGNDGVDGGAGGQNGVLVNANSGSFVFQSTARGGAGSDGENGNGFGGAGGGGAGGYGAAFSGTNATINAGVQFYGGRGGRGGTSPNGYGGGGGDGGEGFASRSDGIVLRNNGDITGGDGGAGSSGGADGRGGDGVYLSGSNTTLYNSGRIVAGDGNGMYSIHGDNQTFFGTRASNGVYFSQTTATLHNSGLVQGGAGGDGVTIGTPGKATDGNNFIDNSGSIVGGRGGGNGISTSAENLMVQNDIGGEIEGTGATSSGVAAAGIILGGTTQFPTTGLYSILNAGDISSGVGTSGAAIVVKNGSTLVIENDLQGSIVGQANNTGGNVAGISAVGGHVSINNAGDIQGGGSGAGIIGQSMFIVNTGAIRGGDENGNAIDFTGGSNSLAIGSNAVFNGSLNIESGTLVFDQSIGSGLSTDTAVATSIVGEGTIRKIGSGTLTFSNQNTYAGGTSIEGGTLVAAHADGVGNIDAVGTAQVALNGGTLRDGLAGTSHLSSNILIESGGGTLDAGEASFFQLSATISGTGDVTYTGGAGKTIIVSRDIHAGATVLSGQVIVIADGSDALSTVSDFHVGAGTTLLLGASQTIASLADGPGGGGTVSGLTSSTLALTGSAKATFSGTLADANFFGSGTLNLFKQGSGTQTLAGANTYSGATTISQGTLALAGNGSLANSTVVVANQASFDISGTNVGGSIRSLLGVGSVTLGGKTLTLVDAATDSFGGRISGTGGLALAGGTESLTSTNTYSGGTAISGGTLVASHADGSGNIDALGTGTIHMNGGALQAGLASRNVTVTNAIDIQSGGGTFDVGNGSALGLAGAITGQGDMTLTGGANKAIVITSDRHVGATVLSGQVIVVGQAANSFSSASDYRVGAGTTLFLNGNQTIASLSDGPGGGGLVTAGFTSGGLTLDGTGSTGFSGRIVDGGFFSVGPLSLQKQGNGTQTLSGANTYSGGTTIFGGTLDLDAAAAVDGSGKLISGAAGTGAITFAGAGNRPATLSLEMIAQPGNGVSFGNTLSSFGDHDALDLKDLSYSGAIGTPLVFTPGTAFGTGVLTVTEDGRTETFALSNVAQGTTYYAHDDTHGGTLIDTNPLCFAAGTLIRTAWGDVPVEELIAGDLVVTASGAERAVAWTSHRKVVRPGPTLGPVRILAGAFGETRPERDLWLSPGHPVLVGADADGEGGHLVPIMCLINGTTITRVTVDEVTYWHVELDEHDILLAEGLAAESYIDLGSRPWFAGANGGLYDPDLARPGMPGRCRPVAIEGPVVAAERQRLDTFFAERLVAACHWPSTEDILDAG